MDGILENSVLGDGIRVFFFDLDGCIYFGGVLADGANELLALLRAKGVAVGFITNNSRETSAEIRRKLIGMGLAIRDEEIIVTATEGVADYLAERYGASSVKVAGSASLSAAIELRGHRILGWEDRENADLVVVGRDTGFNYVRLQQIVKEALKGARIVGTNSDASHPGSEEELVPETGSLLASVRAIVEDEIESIGKPHPYLYEIGMRAYGASPSECVMVGDNLMTDIVGAARVGMPAIWVGGAASDIYLDSIIAPVISCHKLSDLFGTIVKQ